MAGIIATEGLNVSATFLFKGASVDRAADMYLGLFTNASGVTNALTAASVTQPTGAGGYAMKTLTDASWAITGSVASYAPQAFIGDGGSFSAAVYGYFIITKGATPRLIAIEIDPAGQYAITSGDTYVITPTITLA
jgi:hypothetical protein